MTLPVLLAIGLLGGAGAMARFVIDAAIAARTSGGFPLGILVVNLSGALVLGVVTGATLHGDALRLVATGLLASYTTFSTWMFDSQRLAAHGWRTAAALNVVASLALGLLAVWLGREIGSLL